MKWCIYQTANCNIIEDFLNFNEIDYQLADLWDEDLDFGHHNIPPDLLLSSNNVLIISIDILIDLLDWPVSRQNVTKFLHNNYVWVWSDADGFTGANPHKEKLIDLDLLVPKDRLRIFIDAEPSKEHYINRLQNILVIKIKYGRFMKLARINNARLHKESNSKDFLLLTFKKKRRPHRKILWRELNSRNLINKGNVFYNTSQGKLILNNNESDFKIPVVELYQKSWLEIVPETLYKNGYFFTEKTGKPISTKTPFLAVSTMGYLEYLKSLGFQTFSSLISEKYDQQHKIQDRVTLIVDQLEDIIRNGSESFYRASQSILDHNYNILSEITGKWQHQMDAIIQQSIDQLKSD